MPPQHLNRNAATGEFSQSNTATGSTVVGNGLLGAGATTGFLAIPTSALAPVGVPADVPSGYVALCYCTGDNKLYVYEGAWVASAALA